MTDVVNVDELRFKLEKVGLDPLRVNYLLATEDSYDIVRLKPTAFMGFVNVLSNQYK